MEPQWGLPPPRPPLAHTLHPGDVACVERGDCLETLLGSCVAVVLTDPRRSIGAMCHIVHSSPAPRRAAFPETHADAALEAMYAQLGARGIQYRWCQAFVYGGGNMFPGSLAQSHVGAVNGRFVLERLQRDGVAVLFQDLGGATYRKLSWTVGPGMPQVIAVDVTGYPG